jgi:hypothetical protein
MMPQKKINGTIPGDKQTGSQSSPGRDLDSTWKNPSGIGPAHDSIDSIHKHNKMNVCTSTLVIAKNKTKATTALMDSKVKKR